jgi:hypothetical protein
MVTTPRLPSIHLEAALQAHWLSGVASLGIVEMVALQFSPKKVSNMGVSISIPLIYTNIPLIWANYSNSLNLK